MPEDDKKWTPERVRALRARLKLTQAEAGARVGVGRSMWCQWEKGRVRVTRPFEILLTLLKDGKLDGE